MISGDVIATRAARRMCPGCKVRLRTGNAATSAQHRLRSRRVVGRLVADDPSRDASLGGKPAGMTTLAAFVPGVLPPGMDRRRRGQRRFRAARALCEAARRRLATPPRRAASQAAASPCRAPKMRASRSRRSGVSSQAKGKAFVDFQHDVTASDVELARSRRLRSVEHLKRYTTLGMATDQGKTSNVTASRSWPS